MVDRCAQEFRKRLGRYTALQNSRRAMRRRIISVTINSIRIKLKGKIND